MYTYEKAKLRKEMLVRWESADLGWLKLNIDGVAKGNPALEVEEGSCEIIMVTGLKVS